jgi:gas vesicle protein
MIVILGLVILVAAVIAGVAGVVANGGHAHAVTHFAVFGYHVTGSTGTLFLYGIVVGALAMGGLSLLAAGRSSRRGRAARASLAQSRRENAAISRHRDDLISQRDTARVHTVLDEQRNFTASTLGDGDASPRAGRDPGQRDPRPGRPRLFARRPAGSPETLPGQPSDASAAQTPASVPAPAE